MKVCILMGSPRKQGNTNALLGPFRQELEGLGAETETVWLHALEIRPCTACRACQRNIFCNSYTGGIGRLSVAGVAGVE